MNVARILAAFACLFFTAKIFANENADRQVIFNYTVSSSPECMRLPVDVPASIVLKDGQVVVRDEVGYKNMPGNARMMMDLNNCVIRINNALEFHEMTPTLANKLKNAARRFLSHVMALVQPDKPKDESYAVIGGIRG